MNIYILLSVLVLISLSYRTNDTLEWEIFSGCRPWPEDEPEFRFLDGSPFEDTAVLRIVNSFVCAAQYDSRCLAIMVEANIFGLLRPFLELEFHGTSRMMEHGSENIMVYDTSDFQFLELIRDNGLTSLLPPSPEVSTYSQYLRRNTLRNAFDVFLHHTYRDDHEDKLPDLWHINQGWASQFGSWES